MVPYFEKLAQRKYLFKLAHERCLHRAPGSRACILMPVLKLLLLYGSYLIIKQYQSLHMVLEFYLLL